MDCPVCGNNVWLPYLKTEKGKFITGDQRILEGNISKIMCSGCSLVRNEHELTENELEMFYGETYELNTLGHEEHHFFTKDGPIARSEVFFGWITPVLPPGFRSLLEIGCGEGNLLRRFTDKFKTSNIEGVDGSKKAFKLARKKGLNVRQGFIKSNSSLGNKYDVILLVNVIEHVNKPDVFISTLKSALKEKGRIIFTIPIQDYGGYDIFFAEHVWHFSHEQFSALLKNNGLNIVFSDIEHPVNHGIGLYACEINEMKHKTFFDFGHNLVIFNQMRDHWLSNFNSINRQLQKTAPKNVIVFGSGEVLTLLLAFSDLKKYNIVACIDETKEKQGEFKHGIPIYGIDWFENNSCDSVVLAINPKYNDIVKEKIGGFINNFIAL